MSTFNTTVTDDEVPAQPRWVCQIIVAEAALGIVGNLLVCFVILRVKFLHNMTNYLLVNLAVADMLVCLQAFGSSLFAHPGCALVRYVPASTAERTLFCQILMTSFFAWTAAYLSSYCLCVVTLERYVAIVHPFKYARTSTQAKIKCVVALIWPTSVLLALPFLFTNGPSTDPNQACSGLRYPHKAFPALVGASSFLLAYLLPVALMGWAYYKMQVDLKRQAKELGLQQARVAAFDLVRARQRLISMLTIVLSALVILWTPSYIMSLLCLHSQKEENVLLSMCNSQGFTTARGAGNFLFLFNSVINPIIYEFKYKKFKQGLRVAFCSCSRRRGDNRVDIQIVPI